MGRILGYISNQSWCTGGAVNQKGFSIKGEREKRLNRVRLQLLLKKTQHAEEQRLTDLWRWEKARANTETCLVRPRQGLNESEKQKGSTW